MGFLRNRATLKQSVRRSDEHSADAQDRRSGWCYSGPRRLCSGYAYAKPHAPFEAVVPPSFRERQLKQLILSDENASYRLAGMELNFAPDLQAKLNELAAQSGKAADELVQDAVAGYVDELAEMRGMLEGRYADIKSGRVQPIDGEEAFRRLREMSAERRRNL